MSIGNTFAHLTLGDLLPIHSFFCGRPHTLTFLHRYRLFITATLSWVLIFLLVVWLQLPGHIQTVLKYGALILKIYFINIHNIIFYSFPT